MNEVLKNKRKVTSTRKHWIPAVAHGGRGEQNSLPFEQKKIAFQGSKEVFF